MPALPKFEINAKKFLLTYPKCSLSPQEVLEKLQDLPNWNVYTISTEKHQDGTPHIHCTVMFSQRVHTTNPRYFDMGEWHPNIKVLKTKADFDKADSYVRKDGAFITNYTQALSKRAILAKTIIEEGRITPGLILRNPEVLFLNHSSIANWLWYLRKPVKAIPPVKKQRHYWVWGPSNCGKTYWLRAFLSMATSPVEIPTNNDFRNATEETDVLYIDEYKGDLTVQQLNRICDGDTQLNTKGGSTRITYPFIVIVSNYTIRNCYLKADDFLLSTLYNRFVEYDLSINTPPFLKSIIN